MKDKPKRFFCGSKDQCNFKDHYINSRCFAPYTVRQSCPNILRADNKTWREGSKEEMVLSK